MALLSYTCGNKGWGDRRLTQSPTEKRLSLFLSFFTLPDASQLQGGGCIAVRITQLTPRNQAVSLVVLNTTPVGFPGGEVLLVCFLGTWAGGLWPCFELAFLACGWQAPSLHCPCRSRGVTVGGFQT